MDKQQILKEIEEQKSLYQKQVNVCIVEIRDLSKLKRDGVLGMSELIKENGELLQMWVAKRDAMTELLNRLTTPSLDDRQDSA
jgi:hypothetical protein